MSKTAGLLFSLAGGTILLGILLAEIFYPGNYSISQNMISNLGSTRPPHSIIHQPSADIFDYSLCLAGIFILIATGILRKTLEKKFLICAFLMGVGSFGVGVFPAYHEYMHPLVALLAFLAGGLAAVFSYSVTKSPLSYFCIILGLVSLLFLTLGIFLPREIVPILGAGGTERLVVYPLIVWLSTLGGYFMSTSQKKK